MAKELQPKTDRNYTRELLIDGFKPTDETVELVWGPGTKEVIGSAFRVSTDAESYFPAATIAVPALAELADNSLDAVLLNKNRNQPLHLTINLGEDSVTFTDFGGRGADLEAIRRFFVVGDNPGDADHRKIGRYKAGAKAAALGLKVGTLILTAQAPGEGIERAVVAENFSSPTNVTNERYTVYQRPSRFGADRGRFSIQFADIPKVQSKDGWKSVVPDKSALKRDFAEIYRHRLLRKGERGGRMVYNEAAGGWQEKEDKVVMQVTLGAGKTEIVEPLTIPLIPHEGYTMRDEHGTVMEEIIAVSTSHEEPNKDIVWGWVGEIDRTVPTPRKIREGFRVYFEGRLLFITTLGENLHDPRLNALTGEIHLDNIPGVRDILTFNKSLGIMQESEQWQRVQSSMRVAVRPFVEKLLAEKSTTAPDRTPAYTGRVLKFANALMIEAMRGLKDKGVIDEDLFQLIYGPVYGQRNPGPLTGESKPESTPARNGVPWSEQQARTPRPTDANPALMRRRLPEQVNIEGKLKMIDRIIVDSLTTDDPSILVDLEEDHKLLNTLILNSNHPFVRQSIATEHDMSWFIVDQLSHHVAYKLSSEREQYLAYRKAFFLMLSELLEKNATKYIKTD